MRHPRIATLTALIGGLVFASATFAGGWAQVTLDDAPVDPVAGGGTLIGFEVMQHGKTAVSWPKITVIATHKPSGDIVRASATAQGPTGHYVATVPFSADGPWTITFDSPDLSMEGSAGMSVSAAPAVATATSAALVASSSLAPLALGGLAALALALGGGLLLRARRGARRDEPATLSS